MTESVQISVHGKKYSVKSAAFAVDPHEVASLVDSKMQELSKVRGIPSTMDLAILAALNLAQELLELKKQIGASKQESDDKLNSLIRVLEKEVENITP